MRENVVLIDGNNIAYAAYFAHQGLCVQNKPLRGFPTGMLYGFLMSLMRLSEVFKKSPMLIVWDGGGKSWRHREYSAYKANREGRDEKIGKEMSMQFNVLNELLEDLKIFTLRIANAEADDLIGIVCEELSDEFKSITIRSSDMDFYQLLDGRVQTYQNYPEEKYMTLKSFKKEYNVEPKLWPKIRAMSGDKTDNIIGLPNVGLITALRLHKAGIELPYRVHYAGGVRQIIKVPRFTTEKLNQKDWLRVNRNIRLCKIIQDKNDLRMPDTTSEVVDTVLNGFLNYKRVKGNVIDRWTLMKKLNKYEIHDVAMRADDLLFLY